MWTGLVLGKNQDLRNVLKDIREHAHQTVFKAKGIGSAKAMKQDHAQQRRAAKRSVCPGLSEAKSGRIQVQ